MASPSDPGKPIDSSVEGEGKSGGGGPCESRFQKTVCLTDWWLLKSGSGSKGGCLAVAGLTSREQRAMRVFSSAPILKSFDIFTLETTDGVCILIKGFINKARTTENGFPADVFNHFVFGFPPYWKEYAEKTLGVSSCESDVESSDKMDAKDTNVGMKTKSSIDVFPPNSSSVIGEESMPFSSIALESLDKKLHSETLTITDQATLGMPISCLSKKSLRTSSVADECINDSHSHDSGESLSACRAYNAKLGEKTSKNLRKMNLVKKTSFQSRFDEVAGSADEIMNRSKDGLKIGEKGIKSCQTSRRYRTRSKSILSVDPAKIQPSSIDIGSGAKTNLQVEDTDGKEHIDIMNVSEVEEGFANAKCHIISESLNQDKEPKPHNWPSAEGKKDRILRSRNCSSEKDETPELNTRRRLSYSETRGEEKNRVFSASPQSLNLNRSRSGRLLMPTLKFWCNERARYDQGGTITGIESETLLEPLKNGSKEFSPPDKRR